MHCHTTTVALGDTQLCHKLADHVDSADASRRMHHDFITGVRWPSRLGDTDPLGAFVHITARPAAEEI